MNVRSRPLQNHTATRDLVGYVPRRAATPELYRSIGFRCGLEVHQQLKTERKLFCRCVAGRYQASTDYDAQLVRHMRPTLSELGEYDGTALMEFKTRKNIVYRIKGETACTYDIDDTPPFPINREALDIALRIALLLRTNIVGELHITRKQYLDGSIPTGFQRTAIVGIEGEIPLEAGPVRILQLSIEEDSCREISDIGHERIYSTDRLGMPLVETVTHPDLTTPTFAAQAAQYIRYLARSTGQVKTGLGAARQDVNVSIKGGTRVEIKGVQRIRWIPDLTHNEAFRQKALLSVRAALLERGLERDAWRAEHAPVPLDGLRRIAAGPVEGVDAVLVRLPGFAGLLSFFTSPGRSFVDEIADRLRVIACLRPPFLVHSESIDSDDPAVWQELRGRIGASADDGLLAVWGPTSDLPTALETIEERCRWAFDGVPNETRKALPDGTTVFERVLPGPDRMYPDTDSAPLPIPEEMIARARDRLPPSVREMTDQLSAWSVPTDVRAHLLRRNLFPLLQRLVVEHGVPPRVAGSLLGEAARAVLGDRPVDERRVEAIVATAMEHGLATDALRPLVGAALARPECSFDELLRDVGCARCDPAHTLARIPETIAAFPGDCNDRRARRDWAMGRLRPDALGSIPLRDLARGIEEAIG